MLMTDKLSRSTFIGDWTERDLELMSECRLWKHVMCQAISDLYLGSTREKLSVSKWIESPDYEFVCDMAELNASKLKIHLKKIATSKPIVSRYLGERLKKTIQNRSLFN
jgi:hypothetical protein